MDQPRKLDAVTENASAGSRIESVDILVLNWNGRRHLETCLEALAQQQAPGVSWQVVVVDNGSTDDSVSWLEEHWLAEGRRDGLKVRLISSPGNVGFAAGNNLGAEASSADALVLLNNDTAPRREWLRNLVSALQGAPQDVAAVSGVLLSWDEQRVDFMEGQLTFDGHAFQRGFGKPLDQWQGPSDGAELLFACGGNMIIRRSSFLDVGGFDPAYFAYLEDVDLGWRLWSGGERVLLCRDAIARHRSMATSDQLGQNRRGFLFERNAFLTAFKNYDEDFFSALMPSVLLTLLARTRTLVADNNAGGQQVRQDPYSDLAEALKSDPTQETSDDAVPQPTLWQKWRGWGTRELFRRGQLKARRRLAAAIAPSGRVENIDATLPASGVLMDDERSLAQLQAVSFVVDNLSAAQEARRVVQARRRRTDREIFEKFPLALVPTYPGDETLFRDDGFKALLTSDLPLFEISLEELMDMGR